jgi:hypothetical protein
MQNKEDTFRLPESQQRREKMEKSKVSLNEDNWAVIEKETNPWDIMNLILEWILHLKEPFLRYSVYQLFVASSDFSVTPPKEIFKSFPPQLLRSFYTLLEIVLAVSNDGCTQIISIS